MLPPRLRAAFARTRELFRRRQIADELEEELRLHLELEVEHNLARGMSGHEARRTALIAFGGVARFREETREARGFIALDRLVRECRFAARRLRRAPVFAAGVVVTLAVGLGVASAIGALVYGVMLRPLAYPESGRLVQIRALTPGLGISSTTHSAGTFQFLNERARSFAALAGDYENNAVTITDGPAPERVTSAIVTPSVFRVLRTQPALGRLFTDADARADTLPVLISFELWQRRFGGDAAIIGKRMEINRGRRVILGVLPRGFDFPSRASAIYYPTDVRATRASLTDRHIGAVARLAPGVTIDQANAEVTTLLRSITDRFPDLTSDAIRQSGLGFDVVSLRQSMIAPIRPELVLLGLMAGVVLLIASANVATLLLLRAERLRGEVALSRAIGASRADVVRRFLVEGLMVALAAAVGALPVVAIALSMRFGFSIGEIPRLHEVTLSAGVVGGLFALAIVIGIGVGLVSAARADHRATLSAPVVNSRATGARLAQDAARTRRAADRARARVAARGRAHERKFRAASSRRSRLHASRSVDVRVHVAVQCVPPVSERDWIPHGRHECGRRNPGGDGSRGGATAAALGKTPCPAAHRNNRRDTDRSDECAKSRHSELLRADGHSEHTI